MTDFIQMCNCTQHCFERKCYLIFMDLPSKVEIKIHYHLTLSFNCAKIQCVHWQYKENAWPDKLRCFLDKDLELAKIFLTMHGTVWISLVIALIGHAGTALHHHFILKDNAFKQMTTGA